MTELSRTPQPPCDAPDGVSWLALVDGELPVADANDWVVQPGCGAVVTFTGTVRDHADGVDGVTHLVYEAYEEQVVPRLATVEQELRVRWPDVARLAVLHRVGRVDLGRPAVVVSVSAPHRESAFAAARFAIDAVKAAVPIWKHEHTADGARWGSGAQPIDSVSGMR